jgi:hypothetical protein
MPTNENITFDTCVHEITPFADDLRVEMSAFAFESAAAETPTSIARSDETWYVQVRWDLLGKLARHLCGTLCLCLVLESIGPGREYGEEDGFCVYIDLDPCQEGPYTHTFTVGPDQIEARRCGSLYLVGVTFVVLDPCGDPGHIAGYCRGSSVMVYPGAPHEEEEPTANNGG